MAGDGRRYWFLGAVVAAAVDPGRFALSSSLIRDQEGIGMGDVKLMAMLGGWLGIKRRCIAFGNRRGYRAQCLRS